MAAPFGLYPPNAPKYPHRNAACHCLYNPGPDAPSCLDCVLHVPLSTHDRWTHEVLQPLHCITVIEVKTGAERILPRSLITVNFFFYYHCRHRSYFQTYTIKCKCLVIQYPLKKVVNSQLVTLISCYPSMKQWCLNSLRAWEMMDLSIKFSNLTWNENGSNLVLYNHFIQRINITVPCIRYQIALS